MKNMNYGKNYQYAHDFKDHFVKLEFMPESLKTIVIYEPASNSAEEKFRNILQQFWKDHYNY
jgi:putative ATPase